MKTKSKLDARRSALIHQKGFDSLEYIKMLVSDTKKVMGLQSDAINEVLTRVNIVEDIL